MESILTPNAVITEGFQLQTVATAEGEPSGILIEESGLSLTLGLANGERRTIQKERVTSRSTAPTSAMPAYNAMLSPSHVADLAAYLLTQKSAPASLVRGGSAAGPDAGNFRGSWWHNRDYGVFVANPFGRAAMKQGQASVVTVRRGEDFRLRFTAVIHAGDGYQPEDAARETW